MSIVAPRAWTENSSHFHFPTKFAPCRGGACLHCQESLQYSNCFLRRGSGSDCNLDFGDDQCGEAQIFRHRSHVSREGFDFPKHGWTGRQACQFMPIIDFFIPVIEINITTESCLAPFISLRADLGLGELVVAVAGKSFPPIWHIVMVGGRVSVKPPYLDRDWWHCGHSTDQWCHRMLRTRLVDTKADWWQFSILVACCCALRSWVHFSAPSTMSLAFSISFGPSWLHWSMEKPVGSRNAATVELRSFSGSRCSEHFQVDPFYTSMRLDWSNCSRRELLARWGFYTKI